MAAVHPEPGCRTLLQQLGLTTVEAVLGLPAVIVGCHPGRHVARVTLGKGPTAVPAFLKRELRVSWKERLFNWWAGFGFVSRSVREAQALTALRQAGILCPEVMATGEEPAKGAFLLLREMTDWVDLRTYLQDQPGNDPVRQRQFARELGETLARVHAAGFDHPDLYSKHIHIHPATGAIGILDWQRSRRLRWVAAWRRCRDLAALNATVSEELVPRHLRLYCLFRYLHASSIPRHRWRTFLRRIEARTRPLLEKRRIRELRQGPLPPGTQDLAPLDNGAVFVTPELRDEMPPEFRALLSYGGFPPGARNHLDRIELELPGRRRALLTRRRVERPRGWFWAWLSRRPIFSPEREQADALFRLQRYGVASLRLLAYGQRQTAPWRQESLLLVELPERALPLADWLAQCKSHTERRHALDSSGRFLRSMHDAGYYLGRDCPESGGLLLDVSDDTERRPLLGSVEYLEVRRQPSPALAHQDLQRLQRTLAGAGCSLLEQAHFLRGYQGSAPVQVPAPREAKQDLGAAETPARTTAECGAEV